MEQTKNQKITNPNYRKFLDTGNIDFISEDQIRLVLGNVKGRYLTAARCLIITAYYTGARPNEILRLKSKDIQKEGRFVTVLLKGSKGGMPRKLFLDYKIDLIQEVHRYANSIMPEVLLFWMYRNDYKRITKTKKGEFKERHEISNKVRYWFKKWFNGVIDITPYFLRHNRMSKWAAAGATDRQLMQMKGSKTFTSIQPYIHLSTETSKKMAKITK